MSDVSTGTVRASYTYSADGVKRKVVDADRRGYRYRGDLVYRLENGISILESASFGGGRIVRSGNDYLPKYFITDHLGSVRVVEDAYGAVEETNDYYPFGSRWVDSESAVSTNRYRFAGKEEQRTGELDFIDFGARMYDPALARWFVQDRYAEKYVSQSPYQYAANNPVRNIDIKGDSIWINFKGTDILYMDGHLYDKKGEAYAGKISGFLKETVKALDWVQTAPEGRAMLQELQGSKNNFSIKIDSKSTFVPSDGMRAYGRQHQEKTNDGAFQALGESGLRGGSGGTVTWKPAGTELPTVEGVQISPATDLAHELFHGLDANRGLLNEDKVQGSSKSEWQAVYRENVLRQQLNIPVRLGHRHAPDLDKKLILNGPLMIDENNQPIHPYWY